MKIKPLTINSKKTIIYYGIISSDDIENCSKTDISNLLLYKNVSLDACYNWIELNNSFYDIIIAVYKDGDFSYVS